jgi:tRNA A-37 threonylcarbamoyl transferase component Bud32
MEWAIGLFGLVCVGLLVLLVVAGVAVLVIHLTRLQRLRRWVPVLEKAGTDRAAAKPAARPTALQQCPECGAALDADSPEGMCPQCLLKGAIGGAQEKARSTPGEPTVAFPGPSSPAVADLAALFPQLEILELIGQGGMGAVYKARQPSLDRLVAVKVLPPETGRDPAFAERFNREARALARLSHPNIVAVHDVGRAGEYYYFVMEYIDGVNLRQLLHDGHLRPEQALRIVPQICDALQYAHEEGVVHRDIKPENILLDRKGRVKIADFGLAKLLGRDTENFTLTGSRQVMGTLYYMAPEQVERPLTVDHRADIYSLGVVFYEMLTGQLPVGRFPLPSERAGTDAHLDGIVLHALEREPERRYQHASDVKTDVESRGGTAPSVARAPGADRELALHQLQGPAKALMVMGLLGPLGLLIAFLIVGVAFAPEGEKLIGPVFVLFLANVVVGAFLVVGARKMERLEAYEFSVLSSGMVGLQLLTPTWPISLVVGGWTLWILLKPEVKAAFKAQLERSLRSPAPVPPDGIPQSAPATGARARVAAPSRALLVTGITYTAFTVLGSLIVGTEVLYSHPAIFSSNDKEAAQWTLLVMLALLAQGPIIIMGALKMRHLESYGWALSGGIVALVPVSPLAIFGLPVGVWALSVLTAPEVKAAFPRDDEHLSAV